MKPTATLLALLACPVLAHAQGVKMYVARPRVLVQEGPLIGTRVRHLNGYLHAGDSVMVDPSREPPHSANPQEEAESKAHVWVWYPAYPHMPSAAGGWVVRKYLVSQRDSIVKQ